MLRRAVILFIFLLELILVSPCNTVHYHQLFDSQWYLVELRSQVFFKPSNFSLCLLLEFHVMLITTKELDQKQADITDLFALF